MIEKENLSLFENLPVYPEDLEKIKEKKKKDFQNTLFTQINRLMNHFKVEASELHRATGIPHPTLSDWIRGKVNTQSLDENIKKLAKFFGVTVDFIAYGTPESERDLELDDLMEDFLDERE